MKTIEERVADAIAELEGLLTSGEIPEDAISIAAQSEDLRPEVLRSRAEKALGNLQAVKAKNDLNAGRIAQRRKAKSAVYEFAEMDKVYADFPTWFEVRTGRMPTQAETEEMGEALVGGAPEKNHNRDLVMRHIDNFQAMVADKPKNWRSVG